MQPLLPISTLRPVLLSKWLTSHETFRVDPNNPAALVASNENVCFILYPISQNLNPNDDCGISYVFVYLAFKRGYLQNQFSLSLWKLKSFSDVKWIKRIILVWLNQILFKKGKCSIFNTISPPSRKKSLTVGAISTGVGKVFFFHFQRLHFQNPNWTDLVVRDGRRGA